MSGCRWGWSVIKSLTLFDPHSRKQRGTRYCKIWLKLYGALSWKWTRTERRYFCSTVGTDRRYERRVNWVNHRGSGRRISSFSLKEPTGASVSDKRSHPVISRAGLVNLSQTFFWGFPTMPFKITFLSPNLSSIRLCGNRHVWLQEDYVATACRSAAPDGLCQAVSTYIQAQSFYFSLQSKCS